MSQGKLEEAVAFFRDIVVLTFWDGVRDNLNLPGV